MCGIAGLFSLNRLENPQLIKSMTDTLSHRGPDDEGFLAFSSESGRFFELIGKDSQVEGQRIESFEGPANLLLGHRRLSILDLSPLGHQPMPNRDKTLWIVYNGEVYNYVELREELKRSGFIFKTQTDTEVLLAAYEKWGTNCLKRLNGMWAFVLWDKKKHLLFGSRDRFGVKPLYYYLEKGGLAFASEIKALLQVPSLIKKINEKILYDYLTQGVLDQGEETFFQGITRLKPAHYFIYNLRDGSFREEKYYQLKYNPDLGSFDFQKFAEYKGNVRELIFQIIKSRLRSDVPVGSCLSGGLDSSAIVCVINEFLKKEKIQAIGEKQKAFTACYRNEPLDESPFVKRVVEKSGVDWHPTYPAAETLKQDLEDIVYYQEEPFGSTSIYAQYRVMKLARENGVKVLLDGQGGDEIFAGYSGYFRVYHLHLLREFRIAHLLREFRGLSGSFFDYERVLGEVAKGIAFLIIPHSLMSTAMKRTRLLHKCLNKDFNSAFKDRVDFFKERKNSNFNGFLALGMDKLETLLKVEDRNSMRFSIEARTPFADGIDLIDYLFSLPAIYKINGGWSKCLLREAMAEILPKEIRFRKEKIQFATPEKKWLLRLSDELREIFQGQDAYLNTSYISQNFERIIIEEARESFTDIWRPISYIAWKNTYHL